MTTVDQTCRACGAALRGGRFCGACGAAAGTATGVRCPRCGATTQAGARFCLGCGRPLGARPDRWPRVPLILGGVAVITLIAALFLSERQTRVSQAVSPAPIGIAAGNGAPPDLSQMSPRERFDRLYNRVMQASETGDTATVAQFTPMALAAYGMLDSVDADARYHAAMLRLHTGDAPGAAALADTILTNAPTHLFGYVIRGTLARWERDESALTVAHTMFVANYDIEQAANRSEYRDHKVILDRFLEEARRK